ncbi:MAG TPA: ATP-binding protein, partial [Gammaproteobacteria bacterium]|nr:ATP-binding protein [Gammaproteobacteria bacterium]
RSVALGIINELKKNWHAYLIAFLGFLISLALFYALQIQEKRYTLNIAQLGVETIISHLQAELAFNAHLLKELATQENKAGANQPKLEKAEVLSTYTQLKALAEIDKNLKIKWLETSSQAALYRPLIEQFLQEQATALGKRQDTWVSSAFELAANKTSFIIMVLPYLQKGSAPRYFLVLIDCSSLIYQNVHLPGMSFKIYLNKKLITPHTLKNEQAWILEVAKTAYGALWQIRVQEVAIHFGMIRLINKEIPPSWLTFILGILISILFAKSTALSDLLRERTIVLDKINQNLKDEIENHVQTETSKKNLEKALLQGQKLQAIGTLAGGIAHDFNNILYAIRGYVELAREEIPKEEITYKNLGKVLDATYRGQDLITQILTFSRRHQHHEFLPLSLKTEITGALTLLRPTVPQTVEIRFEASSEGKIKGNKTQIHQVIVNLINNAVDAMDGEGTITISLSDCDDTEIQELKISPLRFHKYCRIDIKDSGHGMDQSTIDRVFEPFFTTKEVGKGTGLGLSTVHSLVKDHQGEIVINSQPGKGSTFTLFFPECEDEV